MRKVRDYLGILFGALSLVLLAKRGFNLGFAVPFEQALHYYDQSLHQLLGWSEPYLKAAVRRSGYVPQFHPHWKDVLVLMSLYFGTVAKVIWPTFRSARERSLLLILTVWGALIALTAAVAAGSVDLGKGSTNVIMVSFPMIGFVLYQLVLAAFLATLGRQENWWNRYRAAARLYVGPRVIATIVVVLAIALFSERVPLLSQMKNPSLVLLFGVIVLIAGYWLWTGVEGAVYFHKPDDRSWWQTFREMNWRRSWAVSSNARIGLGMLKCIGGAVGFVLLGAGLE